MTTKEKFLKSALKLFASQGIDKTSTTQISSDLGLSSGALFRHFETKQDLIDELYFQVKTKAFSDFGHHIQKDKCVEDNIKALSKYIIEHLVQNYEDFMFMELIENDPQVSQSTIDKTREMYEDVSLYLLNSQKSGDLKKIPPDVLGKVVWSLVSTFVKSMKEKKQKTISNAYLDVIWEAVKK